MSMMPLPRVQISHPTWCTGAHDDPADATDPRHESAYEPMVCTVDDFLVTASLCRTDEIRHGTRRQFISEPGIVLAVTSTAMRGVGGRPVQVDPLLTLAEARQLGATLLRLTDQAVTETGEVCW